MSERNMTELPDGWEFPALAEIAQINPPLDRCIVSDDIEIDFVPMRAVDPEGGGLRRPEVATYGLVKKGYTPFLPGDVIMAKITPCMENGKTCVVPNLSGAACFGSTEFHIIRPEQGIESRWISNFLLQHSTRHAAQRQMMGGVGQMRVPAGFLESLNIPIPPHREQQRSLEKLDELRSALDAGVLALELVRAKLKQYRSSVLKAAMEGGLTVEWRRLHPYTEPASEFLAHILAERRRSWEDTQLRKFRDTGKEPPKNWKARYQEPSAPDMTNLPNLPEGWCWASLGQLSIFTTSGSRGWAQYYADKGPLFIRSQDIRTDSLVLTDVAHVKPPESSEGARTRLHRGDLLITITGANVAKAALVDCELEEAYVSQHVGMTRFVKPESGAFAHLYITAPSGGRKVLLKVAYGAGKPGLNLDSLRELAIPFPPEAEQLVIVDLAEDQLSVIDHLEADLEAKLNSAQALRQSTLRHVFEGKLVPQDPNDEPARELVKRIATERKVRAALAKQAKAKRPKPREKATRKRSAKHES